MCLLVLTNSCFGSEERLVSGFVRSLRVLLGIILVAGILLLGFFGDKIYRSAVHSRLPTARTPSQSASSAFGTLRPSVPRRRADRETLRVFVLSFVFFLFWSVEEHLDEVFWACGNWGFFSLG